MGGFVSVIPPNNTYSVACSWKSLLQSARDKNPPTCYFSNRGVHKPTHTTPNHTSENPSFFCPASPDRQAPLLRCPRQRASSSCQGWGPVGGAAGQAAALRQLRHPPGRRAGTVPAAARDATGAAAGCVAAGAAVEAVRPAHDVQGGVHSRHKHKHTHPCTNVDQLPPLFHHHQLCRTKEDNFRVGTVTLCMSLKRRLFPLH